MSLLVVSASLHSESYSRLLAREAERVLHDDGHAVEFADLRDQELPICDGEKAYQHPAVARAQSMVGRADGILLATPIYNYDVSAATKNLVELTGKGWEGKVAGFLCTAGGQGSYMSVMALANSLMLDFRTVIVPRFVYATGAAFTSDAIIDPKITVRGVELVLETPPPETTVSVDPRLLSRLFYNLLNNAVDEMSDGGRILLRFVVGQGELQVEIEDTGRGIAPEIANSLFQPFASHGKAHGTGLGLTICKKIIEDHGGRIWTKSAPGKGATFCFTLPLSPAGAAG